MNTQMTIAEFADRMATYLKMYGSVTDAKTQVSSYLTDNVVRAFNRIKYKHAIDTDQSVPFLLAMITDGSRGLDTGRPEMRQGGVFYNSKALDVVILAFELPDDLSFNWTTDGVQKLAEFLEDCKRKCDDAEQSIRAKGAK